MASNSEQGTVSPSGLRLALIHEMAVRILGGSIEGDQAHLLERMIGEQELRWTNAYVYFEDGVRQFDPEEDLDEPYEDAWQTDDYFEIYKAAQKLCKLGFPHVLREILKINTDTTDHLKYECGATCGAMREGEFGGLAVVVTLDEYASVSTYAVGVHNGKIELPYRVKRFDAIEGKKKKKKIKKIKKKVTA